MLKVEDGDKRIKEKIHTHAHTSLFLKKGDPVILQHGPLEDIML